MLPRNALHHRGCANDWRTVAELYAAVRSALSACILWDVLDDLKPIRLCVVLPAP
jgi:hypothetical protein